MTSSSIFAGLPNHLIRIIIKQGYSDGIKEYWDRDIPKEHRVNNEKIMYFIQGAAKYGQGVNRYLMLARGNFVFRKIEDQSQRCIKPSFTRQLRLYDTLYNIPLPNCSWKVHFPILQWGLGSNRHVWMSYNAFGHTRQLQRDLLTASQPVRQF